MRSLKDRIALVTGASSGIGRTVSVALAREGCKLILLARNVVELNETCKAVTQAGSTARMFSAELADLSALRSTVNSIADEYGSLDILFNGACGWIEGPLEQNGDEALSHFLDASVRGSILLTKLLLPLLLSSDLAHVINVITDWEFPVRPGLTAFIASKRALAGMGIALQKEKLGSLRVTNLHPGDVASREFDLDAAPQDVLQKTGGKMIPPKDLVDIVLLILKLEGAIIHQVDVKPLSQDVGMTFL